MNQQKSTLIRVSLGFQTRCLLLSLQALETFSSSNTKTRDEKPFSGDRQLWKDQEKSCLLVISKSLLNTSLLEYLVEGEPGCW